MSKGWQQSKCSGEHLTEDQLRLLQTTVPRTDDDLWHWVRTFLNVEIPRERVCSNHCSPFQAFADAYFARSPVTVWKASRGFGGKSFLLALLSLTEQITLGASINLLGGSGEQSQRVHSYINGDDTNSRGRFWDSPISPRWMLKTDPGKKESRLNNGGFMKCLMASGTSVRGPHPIRLRLDEVDEMDIKIFDAAMGQTMASRGIQAQTVCSSTHHHPDKTMTEVLKRAGEKGWKVYEWCFRENLQPHGWLTQAEVDRKKGEVSTMMWNIEYELQEPSGEDRAIDTQAVDRAFSSSLGRYEGKAGETIEIIRPHSNLTFYTGADWAKSIDWTIINTFLLRNNGPDIMACWRRTGRKPWPTMVNLFNKDVSRYKSTAYHDVTGIGNVIHDYLEVKSKPWDFSKRRRTHEILTRYVAAIEEGDILFPLIEYAMREHKFATFDQLYGSEHLPDTIAAGALAWYAQNRIMRGSQAFAVSR